MRSDYARNLEAAGRLDDARRAWRLAMTEGEVGAEELMFLDHLQGRPLTPVDSEKGRAVLAARQAWSDPGTAGPTLLAASADSWRAGWFALRAWECGQPAVSDDPFVAAMLGGHWDHAIQLAKESGYRLLLAEALTRKARELVDRRQYASGSPLHRAALEIHVKAKMPVHAAANLGGLGLCRLGSGQVTDAVPLLRQAVRRCADAGHKLGELGWRWPLDDGWRLLQRPEQRLANLECIVKIADQLQHPSLAKAQTERLALREALGLD